MPRMKKVELMIGLLGVEGQISKERREGIRFFKKKKSKLFGNFLSLRGRKG